MKTKHTSIKQTAKLYEGTFTEQALRHLINRRKENGIDKCISKLGKKILIDLEAFEEWLDEFKINKLKDSNK